MNFALNQKDDRVNKQCHEYWLELVILGKSSKAVFIQNHIKTYILSFTRIIWLKHSEICIDKDFFESTQNKSKKEYSLLIGLF